VRIFETDTLIIGGGIFGLHSALTLAEMGGVIVVEKCNDIISQASMYNQTRVHTGAHYPRATNTALTARKNLERFLSDFDDCINTEFQHYYGIARENSLTSASSFERFLGWLNLPFTNEFPSEIKRDARIVECFKLNEFSFDPYLMRVKYMKMLEEKNITVYNNAYVVSGSLEKDRYHTNVKIADENILVISKRLVNTTYSELNYINELYSAPKIPLRLESARLLFLSIPSFKGKAITIMDGPFLSLTPYGVTGLHVLTSVIYTHKKIHSNMANKSSSDEIAEFNKVNDKLMLNQMESFIPYLGPYYLQASETVVKATVETQDDKDERPTVVHSFAELPGYYAIMSGKVSSIYDVEEYFKNEQER